MALSIELITRLRTFWRIKAGVASLLANNHSANISGFDLAYSGVPVYGPLTEYLKVEPLSEAFGEVSHYIKSGRLNVDTFYALIGAFETHLCSRLFVAGKTTSGPLGKIQKEFSRQFLTSSRCIAEIDEIRERRNALIHSSGVVGEKYRQAADRIEKLNAEAPVKSSVHTVEVSDLYLTYSASCMISFANV